MRKGKVVVLGTLAGLASGAIAGLLLAPEKGSRTRKQIIVKADDFMDELKLKFDEFRDSLAGKLESTKRSAENLAEIGNAKYVDVKRDVKNATSDFKHAVS